MEWNVYYHNWNKDTIELFNIFNHASFRNDVEKCLRKYKDKDEFADKLKSSLFYYFCSKCEWEIVITPWIGNKNTKDIKIDIYDQVINNFNIFCEYVWNSKIHRPRKKMDVKIDTLENQIKFEEV